MKEFFIKFRKWPASRFLALAVVLLASAVLLGPRLVETAKWNAWAVQFMLHALGSARSQRLPEAPSTEYAIANIWLAQDALAGGNAQLALDLVEPLVLQDDTFALHVKAEALEQQGNYVSAVETLSQARDYNLLIALGNELTVANDQADALAAFIAAQAIDPEAGTVQLADFLINEKKDLPGAESILKNALLAFPTSDKRLSWYRRLGDDLRDQQRLDEAAEVYKAALGEYPKDWALHIGLGWTYYDRGDGVQKAMDEFQKAIAVDETDGHGYFAIAQVLTRERRFSDADPWYVQAIARGKDNAWWYVARANNARTAGGIDRALSIYQGTIELFPDYSIAYYEMALAFQMDNQPQKAISSIEKAISLMKPADASYYALAGGIYEWTGDSVRALKAYQQVLKIDPDNSTALNAISRLNGQ
jgi:tetratricopeptide (TPR) repeat protein